MKSRLFFLMLMVKLTGCGSVTDDSPLKNFRLVNTENIEQAQTMAYTIGDTAYLVLCNLAMYDAPAVKKECSHKDFAYRELNFEEEFIPLLKEKTGEIDAQLISRKLEFIAKHAPGILAASKKYDEYSKVDKSISSKDLVRTRQMFSAIAKSLKKRKAPAESRRKIFEEIVSQMRNPEEVKEALIGTTEASLVLSVFKDSPIKNPAKNEEE